MLVLQFFQWCFQFWSPSNQNFCLSSQLLTTNICTTVISFLSNSSIPNKICERSVQFPRWESLRTFVRLTTVNALRGHGLRQHVMRNSCSFS